MNPTAKHFARWATLGTLVLALAGCATHDRKQNNTLLGAGLGAATGAVLTEGNPLFTLGGAAAGGLLGNVLTSDDRSHNRYKNRGRGYTQTKHHPRKYGPPRHAKKRNASHKRRRR